MTTRNWGAASLLVLATACYEAELDPTVTPVFVCEDDIDCALGQFCGDGVCRSEDDVFGPSLTILDPPLLQAFPMGETSLSVAFEGSDLTLTDQASDAQDAGFIEVYLDGALIDAVTEGSMEQGIVLDNLPMPERPGLHHIVLSARHLDGERFENPESETHVAFWVDDGREHVGILEPAPATRVDLDDPEVMVEIAALNFTFVNPGFLAPDETTDQERSGYVHLYVDADVPTCLPTCNFDYQASFIPQGLSRVNRMTAERALVLPDGVGTVRLQIVAQTTTNTPYFRSQVEGDEFVFHEVPVQSVLGLR